MRKEQGLGSDGVRECKQQGLHRGFKDVTLASLSADHFCGIISSSLYKQMLVSLLSWQLHLQHLQIE